MGKATAHMVDMSDDAPETMEEWGREIAPDATPVGNCQFTNNSAAY